MMKLILFILLVMLTFSNCQETLTHTTVSANQDGIEIEYYTPDSLRIFGDLYELDKKAPTILLFHQGGSNARGEYRTIIPKLINQDYNILAIDQRMGGQYYGSYNRTLANLTNYSFGDGYSYCDAYNNLESALDFIISMGFSGNKFLWGSSYSASLAIQLANNRPSEIHGVLAFSPASGGPMAPCRPDGFFQTLEVPLIILRPPNEMENQSTKDQFELAKKYGHRTYIAKYGVHGSSMLVEERVNNDVTDTWKAVTTFLDENKIKQHGE